MTHEKKSARDATAIERWNRAVSEAYAGSGAGPDDLLELSDEEIERQLVAAGVDLAETDARAAATYDAVVAKLAAGPAARRASREDDRDEPRSDAAWVASTDVAERVAARPARRSRAVWLAYAVAATAATGGAACVAGHRGQAPHREEPRHEEPRPAPVESAEVVSPPAPIPAPAPPDKQPPGPDRKGPGRQPG